MALTETVVGGGAGFFLGALFAPHYVIATSAIGLAGGLLVGLAAEESCDPRVPAVCGPAEIGPPRDSEGYILTRKRREHLLMEEIARLRQMLGNCQAPTPDPPQEANQSFSSAGIRP